MQSIKFLNSKEKGNILKILNAQFGFEKDLDYIFVQSQKDKIYLISKDLEKIDFSKLRINNIGLYFAEMKDGKLRLSIEGSQLIGPNAKKNILELSDDQFNQWIQGNDIDFNSNTQGYFILKHGNDHIGCAKVIINKILNFVPKNRRLRTIND